MHQSWLDLLFAHWRMPAQAIRPLVPSQLALDLFHEECWIGVVPFDMKNIRVRGLPAIPGLSSSEELNVRTYVTYRGRPGVYFFSLDAASITAVLGARFVFHLPYFHAKMKIERLGGTIHYSSRRRHSSAEFRGSYRAGGGVRHAAPGTLEYFLTERYCLYTVHRAKVYQCEIHHPPWPLQNAEASIAGNTMCEAAGFTLPSGKPLLHFSLRQDVLVWPLQDAAKESL